MIENYIKKAHIYNITAISIGVPSSVQPDKSTVICTTNIRNQKGEVVFKNTNLSEELESYFHIPVFVNNDINNILLYDVMKNHLEVAESNCRDLHWNEVLVLLFCLMGSC
ncbi:MAG: ROK family protein [Blautia faecis]